MNSNSTLYYLPGRGGRLDAGLGVALVDRNLVVSGRETVGEFASLSFQEQIELVAKDIQANFWHQEAKILANSFGAYLFLHAQTLMPAYLGKVLLLSPIVGEFSNNETGTHFVPPRSRKLKELAQAKKYPTPKSCEIHVGEEDWQSNPEHVSEFGKLLSVSVTVVPRAGHMLPKGYVTKILDEWLNLKSTANAIKSVGET
jgi:predicted alpha/beta hydrolase family esterase